MLGLQDVPEGYALESTQLFDISDLQSGGFNYKFAQYWGLLAGLTIEYGDIYDDLYLTSTLFQTTEGAQKAVDEREDFLTIIYDSFLDAGYLESFEIFPMSLEPVGDTSRAFRIVEEPDELFPTTSIMIVFHRQNIFGRVVLSSALGIPDFKTAKEMANKLDSRIQDEIETLSGPTLFPTLTSVPMPGQPSSAEAVATPSPSSTPTPTPTPIPGSTRASLLPIGEKATIRDGAFNLEVTLQEVLRGVRALEMVLAAYSRNNLPEPGHEYILVRAMVHVADGPNEAITLYRGDFDIVSTDGVLNSSITFVSDLEPEFRFRVFPGATVEGWMTWLVSTDDLSPTIVFGADYNLVGGIWFDLAN